METTKFPFDTDSLQKGDSIPAETIERAYSVSRDAKEYGFAVLMARDYITKQFLERGEVVTVALVKGVLRIFTDEEQVQYNADRFRAGIRDAQRAHNRMLGADRSLIQNPQTLEAHDRRIEVQGRMLSAVARERKVLAPTPVARATPGSLVPVSSASKPAAEASTESMKQKT
jgi:hypothetical protein